MRGFEDIYYLHSIIHNDKNKAKKKKMKKLFVAALSILSFSTGAFAQDGDDDRILNEKIGLDGSPMPGRRVSGDMNEASWMRRTTIAMSPFQFTESGVGVGLSYERAVEPQGMLSVYVPFIASFSVNNNSYDYYYGNTGINNRPNYMMYAMPGVKFYPTGMGRCKYAVGPNAVIGYGRKYDNYYYPMYNSQYIYAPYYYAGSRERFLLGMMINNSLNVNVAHHLYIGAELGFGFTYFDRVGGYNEGVNFLTQGSFKIGYTIH